MMAKIKISLTLNKADNQRQALDSREVKGLFLWIGSHGTVDRIVGYHKRKGWIADYCYMTRNHWIKDLWRSLTSKDGFVRVTRFI